MLQKSQNACLLNSPETAFAEFRDQCRIFAVTLFDARPAGIGCNIQNRRIDRVHAARQSFAPDGASDLIRKLPVERRADGKSARKHGCFEHGQPVRSLLRLSKRNRNGARCGVFIEQTHNAFADLSECAVLKIAFRPRIGTQNAVDAAGRILPRKFAVFLFQRNPARGLFKFTERARLAELSDLLFGGKAFHQIVEPLLNRKRGILVRIFHGVHLSFLETIYYQNGRLECTKQTFICMKPTNRTEIRGGTLRAPRGRCF